MERSTSVITLKNSGEDLEPTKATELSFPSCTALFHSMLQHKHKVFEELTVLGIDLRNAPINWCFPASSGLLLDIIHHKIVSPEN